MLDDVKSYDSSIIPNKNLVKDNKTLRRTKTVWINGKCFTIFKTKRGYDIFFQGNIPKLRKCLKCGQIDKLSMFVKDNNIKIDKRKPICKSCSYLNKKKIRMIKKNEKEVKQMNLHTVPHTQNTQKKKENKDKILPMMKKTRCNSCDRFFNNKGYTMHVKFCKGKLKCDFCSKSFATNYTLNRHFLKFHNKV
jgi:DNA-directed RNA polymerase subunit M/transcription elongation factor TFIIS